MKRAPATYAIPVVTRSENARIWRGTAAGPPSPTAGAAPTAVLPSTVWSIEIQVGRHGYAAGFEDMVVVNRDGSVENLTEDLPVRWGW